MNTIKDEYYRISVDAVVEELRTDLGTGLDENQAVRRLAEFGPNELKSSEHTSPWVLFLAQFKNILIQILLFATLLSVFMGHAMEAVAIAVIVLFAVILSFIQEFRAERAIEALRRMAAPTARVIRSGKEKEIPAVEIVVGDLIILKAGDKVPADARIVQAVNLQLVEAALTGESLPVEKKIDALGEGDFGIGDRINMVYSGTVVSYGRGRAVVVATGLNTEFGKITGMLETVETGKTPLQKNLDHVGNNLAKAAGVIVVIIVGLGILRGQPFLEMVIFGIALAVAVVPEALPAVVTISLAIGVQRMIKRHALIRRLPMVETLGCTSVICSDKTGTLTKDEMTIRRFFVAGEMINVSGAGYTPEGNFLVAEKPVSPSEDLISLLTAAVLCSDAQLGKDPQGQWEIIGDPTEGAFVVAAAKAGLSKAFIDRDNVRLSEVPFSSESKRMTTLCRAGDRQTGYSKGAAEIIIGHCTHVQENGQIKPLTDDLKKDILESVHTMAHEALRVLAVAFKPDAATDAPGEKMTFLGLAGMIDPPRGEVKDAVRVCEQAGIKPVLITGDHPLTAQAIARELGILKNGRVVTGVELDQMSDADLKRDIESIDVYARVSPAHKMRVVSAFQSHGHVVAMTGDGVNDAPALKKADVGIAMGITGTDVTKEVSSMMLTDDNFASIVAAVEEGRHIFGNIKKYLMYLISSNIGEIGLMAGAVLLGMPIPLTAVQILYVNLATDGLPALALAVDPPEEGIMKRKPRDQHTGIFSKPVVILMLAGGLWSTVINLWIFLHGMRAGMPVAEAMTMTFVSLILIQFFKAYCYRSDRESVLNRPFANKWLNWAIIGEVIALIGIVYLPFLHKPFCTFSLPLADWLVIIALSFSVVPVLELAKWAVRRGWLGTV